MQALYLWFSLYHSTKSRLFITCQYYKIEERYHQDIGKEGAIEMVNENSSKMAQFISELRKEKKLTQKELAEQLGVTDKAVSKWERGLSYPDISLLSKLSRILGVTTSELLNNEKAQSSAPGVDDLVEATLQYADTATKNVIAKSTRWKYVAIASALSLLVVLIIISCSSAIDKGLAWSILPLKMTVFVWLAAIFGVFVIGKNKMAFLLLCGFIIFITTFYYSALNQTPARDVGTFTGFSIDYLPHYTIILVMFIVSIVPTVFSFRIKSKNISDDRTFLLAAVSITIIILSILTESSIMDYVDINGLGVDWRFSIIIKPTIVINCVSLVLLTKRHKRQITEKQNVGSH
jgi:transcriptional regulator with XRE-family HTH domain